jgi:tetratricopeptide (TPR) repeat protein
VELLASVGYVERRQGRWEEAVATLRKAAELDPGSARVYYDLGETLLLVRRYDEAGVVLRRGIETAPDEPDNYFVLMRALCNRGDVPRAREPLRQAMTRMRLARLTGNFLPPAYLIAPDDSLRRAYQSLSLNDRGSDTTGYYFFRGELDRLSGALEPARARYDSARVVLEGAVRQAPEDYGFRAKLGLTYARLGRHADAIREGRKAVELLPPPRDAYFGVDNVINLATIYASAGQPQGAVEALRSALAVPSILSRPTLRSNPDWDPIRSDPGFQQLLQDTP